MTSVHIGAIFYIGMMESMERGSYASDVNRCEVGSELSIRPCFSWSCDDDFNVTTVSIRDHERIS